MLKKLDKFFIDFKAKLIAEQINQDQTLSDEAKKSMKEEEDPVDKIKFDLSSFDDPNELYEELCSYDTLNEFKENKELIKKIKLTPKNIRDEATKKLFEKSLEEDTQNLNILQIYYYINEFK